MISKPQHYLKNGCDRWKIDFSFTLNDQYIRFRRAGFITEEEAVEWLEKQYHGIKYGFISPPEKGDRPGRKRKNKDTITVTQVFEIMEPFWKENLRYHTVKQWVNTSKNYILPRIGSRIFAKIGPQDLQKIYEGNTDSVQTILSRIIRNMINNAKTFNLVAPTIDSDHFVKVIARKREAYLTTEELEIVLKNAKPEIAPVFMMLAYTGMRIGEAMALDWSDIDLKNRTIVVSKNRNPDGSNGPTKTGKKRIIPLHSMTHEALKTIAQQSGCSWKTSGDIITFPKRRIEDDIKRLRTFLINKPDREEIVIHSLRHTCASLLIQMGESLEKIGYILGQSSAQVTAQYAHLCTASMHSTIDALPSVSYKK